MKVKLRDNTFSEMSEQPIQIGEPLKSDLELYLQHFYGDGTPVWWYIKGNICSHTGDVLGQFISLASYRRKAEMVGIARQVLIEVEDDKEINYTQGSSVRSRLYPFIRAQVSPETKGIMITTDGLSGPWKSGEYGISRKACGKLQIRPMGTARTFTSSIIGQVDANNLTLPFVEMYSGISDSPYMYMHRMGHLPPNIGHGDGVWQAVGRRFTDYTKIPRDIRSYIAEFIPKYAEPPNNEDTLAFEKYLEDGKHEQLPMYPRAVKTAART